MGRGLFCATVNSYLLLVPHASLGLTEFFWKEPTSGYFGDPARWTPDDGPPGQDDVAHLGTGGTYTVTGGPITIGVLTVDAGHVTLENDFTAKGLDTSAGLLLGRQSDTIITLRNSTLTTERSMSIAEHGTATLNIGSDSELVATRAVGSAAILTGVHAGSSATINVSGTGRLQTTGRLLLGADGAGTLNVRNAGKEVNNPAVLLQAFRAEGDDSLGLGGGASGHGKLDVENATIVVNGQMNVGVAGQGTVDIRAGALLKVGDENGNPALLLGFDPLGTGSVTVYSSGALRATGQTVIGGAGSGTLVIQAGSQVSSEPNRGDFPAVVIGNQAGSAGRVEFQPVEGQDAAEWKISGRLIVGNEGFGSVSISKSGYLENLSLPNAHDQPRVVVIGSGEAGEGIMELQGGTVNLGLRSIDGDIIVGDAGRGSLRLSDGAHLIAPGLVVAQEFNAAVSEESGVVEVAGEDTSVLTRGLIVGFGGKGQFIVQDGARVEKHDHYLPLTIGREASASGVVTIQGKSQSGSQATIEATEVVVGGAGAGRLEVYSGGKLGYEDANGFNELSAVTLGRDALSRGFMELSGADVRVEAGTMTSGYRGSGQLTIREGAHLFAGNLDIAVYGQSAGVVIVENLSSVGTPSVLTAGTVRLGDDSLLGPQLGGFGLLQIGRGGRVEANEVHVGSKSKITGSGGTLAARRVINNGTISPGLSPGTLHIEGDLEQGEEGVLEFEIGGGDPGLSYDQLLIEGRLTLAGTISVAFINGFLPELGQHFDLFSATGGVTGIDYSVSFAGVPPGYAFDSRFEADHFILQTTAVPEPSTVLLLLVGAGLFASGRRGRRPLHFAGADLPAAACTGGRFGRVETRPGEFG